MSDPVRRFLLTGASGGIGSAVARELVAHGHAVVLFDPVPPVHEEAARKAAISCPERAIAVEE